MSRHSTIFVFVILAALAGSAGCAGGANTPAAPEATAVGSVQTPQLVPTALGRAMLGSNQRAADLTIALVSAPNPPVRGNSLLEAIVTDAQGKPVTGAQVYLDLDMTNMSHGKNVVLAEPKGDGHYAGRVFFMMPGPWRVITIVQRPGQQTTQARFDFQVNWR